MWVTDMSFICMRTILIYEEGAQYGTFQQSESEEAHVSSPIDDKKRSSTLPPLKAE